MKRGRKNIRGVICTICGTIGLALLPHWIHAIKWKSKMNREGTHWNAHMNCCWLHQFLSTTGSPNIRFMKKKSSEKCTTFYLPSNQGSFVRVLSCDELLHNHHYRNPAWELSQIFTPWLGNTFYTGTPSWLMKGRSEFSCQFMRYRREHTSSSSSSFTSLQLRGAELTTSFEDDALLEETSVASDARGFLEVRSRIKVFSSESEETRVSDLRLGAIENEYQREERITEASTFILEICLFKLTRLWLI